MNEKKVSLGLVICMFIIFILIMALGAMYVYYNYIPKENNEVNTNNLLNTIQNNINDEKNNDGNNTNENMVSLEIDSELVEKLYNYILKFNYYNENLVYQADKVTYANLDNQLKLLTAFENLDQSQAQKVKTTDYTGVIEDDGNSYKYLYTKEIIEQKVKDIFGTDATVIHENCSPHDGHSRIYDDGIYTCYDYAGGGDVPWSWSKSQLIKAEADENYIYLYDIYLHILEVENIVNGINYGGTFDIFATSDRKISIANKINLEEKGVYKGTEDLVGEEYLKAYMNNILNILGEDRIKTFKHTFSKDINGNYYWISTEFVD